MQIKTKYNVGDKVWTADCFSYSREVECLRCKVTGKVKIIDGSVMTCGVCNGRKTHTIYVGKYKYRPRYHTIAGVQVSENEKGLQVKYKFSDQWKRSYVEYFGREESSFFTSFRECRKQSRKLNKKYKWPKKDYVRDPMFEEHRHHWGYRVGKNVNQG